MVKKSIIEDELDENHGEDNEPDLDEALDEFETTFGADIDPELEKRDIHEIDNDLDEEVTA